MKRNIIFFGFIITRSSTNNATRHDEYTIFEIKTYQKKYTKVQNVFNQTKKTFKFLNFVTFIVYNSKFITINLYYQSNVGANNAI